MTEKELLLSGGLYDAIDPQLVRERTLAQDNSSDPADPERRATLPRELFGSSGTGLAVEPPFFCDYGSNITVGYGVFFHLGCVVLDVAPVTIGNHVLFGPNVRIYTATHPVGADERRAGREAARPITIEDDVWVGGSVVTRDVPADVFAAGNPCRVIRRLKEE